MPASPGTDAGNAINTELERVDPLVPMLFEREGPFYVDVLEKRPAKEVSNRDMRIPVKINPGGKFGQYDPELGDMGRGGSNQYQVATINVVYQKFGVEWTDKAEMGTDSARKAVVNFFRDNLADAMDELRRNLDSISMGSGNGVLATVSTYTVGGGITAAYDRLVLDDAAGGQFFGAKLVRFGEDVNIYSTNLAVNRTLGAERTIGYVDIQGKTIDITPSLATGVATDKVVISGVTATPPISTLGVQYHNNDAATGNWLTIDRVTNPNVRASSVDAGGAQLALPFARLAVNRIGDRVGLKVGDPVVAYCHPCQLDSYEQLGQLVSSIRKEAKDEALNLYFGESFSFAGVPAKPSFNWDKKRIDFFFKKFWGRSEAKAPGFYEKEGRRIFEIRGPSGGIAAGSLTYLNLGWNMYNANPACGSYVKNLAILSGY